MSITYYAGSEPHNTRKSFLSLAGWTFNFNILFHDSPLHFTDARHSTVTQHSGQQSSTSCNCSEQCPYSHGISFRSRQALHESSISLFSSFIARIPKTMTYNTTIKPRNARMSRSILIHSTQIYPQSLHCHRCRRFPRRVIIPNLISSLFPHLLHFIRHSLHM